MTLFEQAMGSKRTHAPGDYSNAVLQAFDAFFACSFDAEYRECVDALLCSMGSHEMGANPHFVTQR